MFGVFKINNMPSDAYNYKYIIVTIHDGKMWYLDVWNDELNAIWFAKHARYNNRADYRAVLHNTVYGRNVMCVVYPDCFARS